jgi:hypothetical protein
MAAATYESPTITVLGELTDMTQKHGIYFDFTAGSGLNLDVGIGGINIDVDLGGTPHSS